MEIISWLGTAQPDGLNNLLDFISTACALSFPNVTSNEQCFEAAFKVSTLKGFARNVLDFAQDDNLACLYLNNFHFLLNF